MNLVCTVLVTCKQCCPWVHVDGFLMEPADELGMNHKEKKKNEKWRF